MSFKDVASEFIKGEEGFREKAYWDVNKWAIGYGFREGVTKGQTMTRQEADARMQKEVEKYASQVENLVTNPNATEEQKAALTSFAYNAGVGALATSTLLKKFNAGDVEGAAAEFGRWSNVNKTQFSSSLYRRRMKERALFLGKGDDVKITTQARFTQTNLGISSTLTDTLGELRAMNSRLAGGSSDGWDMNSWTERLRQEGRGV